MSEKKVLLFLNLGLCIDCVKDNFIHRSNARCKKRKCDLQFGIDDDEGMLVKSDFPLSSRVRRVYLCFYVCSLCLLSLSVEQLAGRQTDIHRDTQVQLQILYRL